jgi:EAL domain-containing protein (putative c-di-GMP-specific phosphodiesterase class I)
MGTSVLSASVILDLVSRGGLGAVYQPIVALDDNCVVGWEALARGPAGSKLEAPARLFAAAQQEGVEPELDRACRHAALEGAAAAGLGPGHSLFLNVEPLTLDSGGVLDELSGEDHQPALVVELTERALASRPSDVLAAVRWLRQRGCRIALDDVGADRRSLALMPFVAPDVIKLDAALTQERMEPVEAARVVNAVAAEAERSGAVVLAEGIETERHLLRALAMGATLGQGWLFGRPGPLPRGGLPDSGFELPSRAAGPESLGTPFERIADERRLRRGDKRLLLALSRQLEQEAAAFEGEAVVISTFQEARFYTGRTRRHYERLASGAALVGALGVGLSSDPGRGVRGADIPTDDNLRGEWDVAVVGPHFAGAFVARDLGDHGADSDRRFDYFTTYDRELAVDAARTLLRRIVPNA